MEKKNCYNLTDGGDGSKRKWSDEEKILKSKQSEKFKKPVIQLDLYGNIIKRWESIKAIQKHYKDESVSEISSCLHRRGNSNTSKGYIWIFEKEYNEKTFDLKKYTDRLLNNVIYQIDSKNNIVCKYKNIQDVIDKNPNYNKSSIYGVISGKDVSNNRHKTSYGFVWEYEKKYIKHKDYSEYFKRNDDNNKVKVDMLNKDTGEIIKTFNSIIDASKYIKCSQSNIVACCKGYQKTAKGFKFRYNL